MSEAGGSGNANSGRKRVLEGVIIIVVSSALIAAFAAYRHWINPTRTCADTGGLTLVDHRTESARASSELRPGRTLTYSAAMAVDGRTGSAWVEGAEDDGAHQTLTITLDTPTQVSLVCVLNGYSSDPSHFTRNSRVADYRTTTDAGSAVGVMLDGDEGYKKFQPLVVKAGTTRSLSIEIISTLAGSPVDGQPAFDDTAISEVRIYTG